MMAALAILLYALLADAAIETIASGSSTRWWVASVVVLYLAASVVSWRRVPGFEWRHRATASLFVLIGLLASTAWLPAGHVTGITVAAQPTSRVFTAVSAAAVLVSGLVLLRGLRSTPIWVRAAVVALATYALAALAIGIARDTTYADLLGGGSPWVRAPFWLQGAFVGLFVVVPLGALAALGAAARRIAARATWAREVALAVSLASAVLMAVPALTAHRAETGAAASAVAGSSARFAFADARQLQQAVAERLVDEPPPIRPDVEPAVLIENAAAGVRSLRPEDWDLDALSASLGTDPAAAFAFVRDAIGFDPYAGVLRGAEGTLAARSGNSWDRALLLRALLDKSGLKTRLAFTTLDNESAARLVKRAYQRPLRRLSDTAPTGLLARAAPGIPMRARRDDAALRLALGDRFGGLGVDDGEQVRQEVARHAWVQLQKGDTWVDVDPTLLDAQVGDKLAVASGTADDIPREQQQTVVLKVVAASLIDGRLSESVSLQRDLPAAVGARQHILLAFAPKGESGGLMRATAKPSAYVPTLWIGNETQNGKPITVAPPTRGAGFDALFGGEGPSSVELAALFIDVQTRVPGRSPTTARHVVFDRAEPAAMASAFQGVHHVMISTGGASALDMARRRLRAVEGTPDPAKTAPQDEPASWPSSKLWACDVALVEGSERLGVQALDSAGPGRVFVDQPRVFLASWFAEPSGPETLERDTDLMLDSVRVLPSEPASLKERAERQMQYGALQSALETELGLQMAAAWDPVNRTIVSTSLLTGDRLSVLGPSDVGRLPAGSAGALRAALAKGESAVVPGEVGTARAWWTVERSGFVRAILEPGGGALKEVGRRLVTNRYFIEEAAAAAKPGNDCPGGNEKASLDCQAARNARTAGQAGGDAVRRVMRRISTDGFDP